MRSALSLCLLVAAALLSAHAGASENYPPVIKSSLELSDEPPCTLCHATEAGGLKTVVMPFGRTMMLFGANGGENTNSLREALLASEEALSDSDEDGIGDIDELRMDGDPNWNPGAPNRELPIARHGCSVSARAGGELGLGLTAWFLVFVLGRRRRRAGRPPGIESDFRFSEATESRWLNSEARKSRKEL